MSDLSNLGLLGQSGAQAGSLEREDRSGQTNRRPPARDSTCDDAHREAESSISLQRLARHAITRHSWNRVRPEEMSDAPDVPSTMSIDRSSSNRIVQPHFTVVGSARDIPPTAVPYQSFLLTDNWDDYRYRTLFHLHVANEHGTVIDIGPVKIAHTQMGQGPATTSLPRHFDNLDPSHFSLGQTPEYYENLRNLGVDVASSILDSLGDTVRHIDRLREIQDLRVTEKSLLRNVSHVTIEGQFTRVLNGGNRNEGYDFAYSAEGLSTFKDIPRLMFSVRPGSNPPSNIHALIGGNGVGKTKLLNNIERAVSSRNASKASGDVRLSDGSTDFAGVVHVSFSAFDELEPPSEMPPWMAGKQIRTTRIGLRKIGGSGSSDSLMSSAELAGLFVESLLQIWGSSRDERLDAAFRMLQSDPLLGEVEFESLVQLARHSPSYVTEWFSDLSSGHKIVLLTTARLVEVVEERTLVLLDEPETHLHPPLLSAFINALSRLLTETNGVAIAATHSPVVLQEVPRNCVWIMQRSGATLVGRRPMMETFAENVGQLTHEVFALEVTESGYHARLKDSATRYGSYETVVSSFGGQLGREGRAIARAIISQRGQK